MSASSVENEPSVGAALERIVFATQRVIGDRVDLAFLEAREMMAITFRGLLALGLSVGLLLLAWVAASSMMVFLLMNVLSRSGSLAVVSGINFTIGILLLRSALARFENAISFVETRPANGPKE